MTILSTTEIWTGQTASDDKTGAATYETFYQIVSDTATESLLAVISVLPAMGAPYVYDINAVVTNRSVKRRGDTREVWEATITYEFDPEDPNEPQDDPTAEPAKIRWSSSLELEVVEKDANGDALLNSAGDYFDPPIEWPVAKWKANVTKNVPAMPTGFLTWEGAINQFSYTIDGVTVEALKSRLVTADLGDEQEKNDIPFRVLTLGIEFSEDEYKITPLDQGYRYKDGTTLTDILIPDEDGAKTRPSAPVLLDGAGAVLTDPSTDTAVFLEFDPPKTPQIDFSVLPLT